jgi:hypothetical protein
MFVDGFDLHELRAFVVLADGVDCAVGTAQADRAIALPLAPKRFVVIAGKSSDFFETIDLNGSDLGHQVAHDVLRTLAEVLHCTIRESDSEDHCEIIAVPRRVSTS